MDPTILRIRNGLLLATALLLACGDKDEDTSDEPDPDPDAELANEWGLPMRYPQDRTVDCGGSPQTTGDADWLCTFSWEGTTGIVYSRATPVSCIEAMSYIFTYEAQAWLWVDGTVTELSPALYDGGGNHRNDYLEFDRDDLHFKYYHSSFQIGWRCCQPMDCMQVLQGSTFVEDGCTCDRTLPATCVQVQPDGTWDEMVDTFAVCEGDPDCGG